MRRLGRHLGHRRIEQLHRFDIAPPPPDVGNRDHLIARKRGGAFGLTQFGLGENHHRGRHGRVGIGEIPVTRIATRHLQIDHAIDHGIQFHRLAKQRQPLGIIVGVGNVQLAQAAI